MQSVKLFQGRGDLSLGAEPGSALGASRVSSGQETKQVLVGKKSLPLSVRGPFPSCCFVQCEFMKRLWSVRRCAGRRRRDTIAPLCVGLPPQAPLGPGLVLGLISLDS